MTPQKIGVDTLLNSDHNRYIESRKEHEMYQVTATMIDADNVRIIDSTSMEFDAGETCELRVLACFCDLEMIDLVIV